MKKDNQVMPPISLIDNNKVLDGYTYRGALGHFGMKKDFKPYTWCKEPEFLFAIGATIGKGAMIIFRAIIHQSSKQCNSRNIELLPVQSEPEYVKLSRQLVNKYGLSKVSRFKNIKLLKELGFIECKPSKPSCAPVCRIGKAVLEHQDILWDDEARTRLKKIIAKAKTDLSL